VLLTLGLLAPEVRDAAAAVALVLVAVALLVDVGLFALQALAIRAFCKLCLLTYLLNAAVLIALAPARAAMFGLRGLSSRMEGRLLLAGWVAGSLAVAAAVAGAESTLTLRESERGRALIGLSSATAPAAAAPAVTSSPNDAPAATPASPSGGLALPTPASPGPPALTPEAQHYKELADRLQQTLDDPQKLEQYFTTKAAQDFERAPVQSINLTDVPAKGAENAPVQVVEYSDFLCPFCRQLAGALSAFVPQAGNRVVIYYKNYPLDQTCNPHLKSTLHPGACVLALGGVCAQYQGRFWPYADKVFGTPLQNPGPKDVVRLATEAGLNGPALETCLGDPRTKERLTVEIAEGQRVGVQATPTIYINGKKLPRIQDFVPTVDKEAQKKGFPPLPASAR
jgi:protein-disulfide isomerase